MKRIFAFCAVATLALWLTPLVHAQQSIEAIQATQATQVNPGTQVRLQLVDSLNTTVAHNGDTFTAIVAEPVFSGNTLLLPAGSKIHGTITEVSRPKLFSMFRGGASMNLVFNSVEVQSRIFPARMSILQIYNGGIDTGKQRKDLRTIEGEVVEEHQGVANDVEDVAIGTAGGSTVGLIFSHVLRGTVIGLVGGSAYVVAKKGKDVELPAQTGMLVRMDSTLSLPSSLLHSVSYQSGGL